MLDLVVAEEVIENMARRGCLDVPSALCHGGAAGQGEHRLCMHSGTCSREWSQRLWRLLAAIQDTGASASREPLPSPSQQ